MQRIAELEGRGDLHRHVTVEAVPQLREVFVSRQIAAFLDGAVGVPKKFRATAGQALMLFDGFVAGREISFGLDPRSHTGALIARNEPLRDRICDFRVLHPQPSIRIFGAFAERDLFIAVTYQPRARLTNVFHNAVTIARGQWDNLFPDHEPVYSEKIDDYVGQPYHAC